MSQDQQLQRSQTFHPVDYFRAWAQLVRLPNVLTAPADVLLGYWIALPSAPFAFDPSLSRLLGASACLYASGMVWNDVFDREVDRLERPHRPIPSGMVPLKSAVAFASVLMAAGVFAALLASWWSAVVALGLCVSILTYDALAKFTPVGPPTMGLCRFLNVALGMSPIFAGDAFTKLPIWLLLIPLANGVYITGVTWFSRQEATASSRLGLSLGALGMAAGLGLHACALYLAPSLDTRCWIMGAIFAATLALRIGWALCDPSPLPVQHAVKTAILGLVVIDATLLLGLRGPEFGAAALLLLVPALAIGRWVYST